MCLRSKSIVYKCLFTLKSAPIHNKGQFNERGIFLRNGMFCSKTRCIKFSVHLYEKTFHVLKQTFINYAFRFQTYSSMDNLYNDKWASLNHCRYYLTMFLILRQNGARYPKFNARYTCTLLQWFNYP